MHFRTQRLLSIGSLILVLAFVLGSCAPAATPTPTPAPLASPTAAARPGPSPTSAPQPTGQPPTPTAVRPAASPTSAVAPTLTPVSEQPKYGGTLFLGSVADPGSLDSMAEGTTQAGDLARIVYNSMNVLDYYDVTRPYVPVLAERWTVSADGLTYTFFLRKDVKFHDGTPMTANDVVYTIQRYANPPSGVRSTRAASLAIISSISAADSYTVSATVKARSAAALSTIGGILVYSKAWLEAGNNPLTDVNGTSAFKLKTRVPDVSYEYIKNPAYWKPGRPYLDGVTVYIIKDASTRVAAIRTGRIQLSQNYFSSFLPSDKDSVLKSVPGLNTWPNPIMNMAMFVPNLQRKPWNDLRVRQAMSLTLDRQEWIKVVGQGVGTICGLFVGSNPPGVPCEELQKRPGWRPDKTADRAEAKRLLAEAGFPNGIKTTLMVRSIPAFVENAIFLADQLSTIGIQATLDVQELAVADSRGRRQDFELGMWRIQNASPDRTLTARAMFLPGQVINFNAWNDPKYIDIFNQQDSEVDPAKRAQLVRDLDDYTFQQLPIIFGAWTGDYYWAWPQVKNYPLYDTGGAQNALDQIWLAK